MDDLLRKMYDELISRDKMIVQLVLEALYEKDKERRELLAAVAKALDERPVVSE